MKKNLILGWLLCLAPAWVGAQEVDTVAVVREVDSLIQVSRALTGQGEFEKALEINAAAEKRALEKFGRESVGYGNACFNHGRILDFKNDLSQAEKWYTAAKDIREKILGKEHPDYAKCLNNLAGIDMSRGNYKNAERLFLEAKVIWGKSLGKEHTDYAGSLVNLGVLNGKIGKYDNALLFYLEAKEIFEHRPNGREHPYYMNCLTNLAMLYKALGDYEKAEPFYLETKSLREKHLGKEHPDYAASLNNLAVLYFEMGLYEKAEPLHLEAKAIREKKLGKEHLDYAESLQNLAALYRALGDYEKAELFYLEATTITEKTLGKEHSEYARLLYNLANLYSHMCLYEKAEPLSLEAKSIREKSFGKENPDYAWSLNQLASLYINMNKYEKAESLYIEAKTLQEKLLGTINPDYAWSLNALAELYTNIEQYEKAEPLYLEAKAICEKSLGKEHPVLATNLTNLSKMYEMQNRFSESEPLLAEVSTLEQARLSKAASFLSERELANYTATFQYSRDDLGSYIFARQAHSGQTGTLPALAFDHALFHKGFLLTAAARLNTLAAASPESEEINLRLKGYRRRLAAQYAEPIAERKGVTELEEKAGAAEKELARSVAGYAEAIRQVNWQEVQAALKKDEAAIEFVHFRVNFPKKTDSTLYAALLLRPGDPQPQFIPLFEEKELAPLLRGAAGGSNFLKINSLYAQKAIGSKEKSLYELIWQPLESLLAGSKTIFCSPSGLLHRINLSAIQTNDGKAFGDRCQLVLLGSTRQLVVLPVATPSENSAYLVGGIRYDTDSTAIAYANRSASGSRSTEQPSALAFQPDSLSATRGGVLDYLPATAAEVREIGQTLSAAGFQAKVDTGFYATEEAFRQLGVGASSPRIVHIATHGYFFPDPVSKGQKANSNFGQEPVFKMSDHPMIRSGLILAGAKQAWLTGKHPQGQEDGILTAYEISQMNLSGTELVVLSACETGLGDILGNEGVYGLQRAFKIAGAKYLIMSLWKVDDRSAEEFMTAFYRHWLTDKQPVPQAFRAAQRELRAKRAGAYDWAGFVLVE